MGMGPNELPSVSVILPVRNGARHLSASMQSLAAQDHPALEILVYDHGSSDNSAEIARSFAGVQCVPHATELSIAAARNAGIRAARGELVAFASHDDLWEPDKLRRQAQAFRDDPLLQLCVAHVRCFLDDGLTVPPEGLPGSRIGEDLPGWLTETVVARRQVFDLVGYFDQALRQAEDTEWLARARDFPVRWKMQPETLVLRRIHAGNLTYRRDTREQGVLELLEIARRSVARKRSGERVTGH